MCILVGRHIIYLLEKFSGERAFYFLKKRKEILKMPFKKNDSGIWVPDLPEFELGESVCVGDWNQGIGGGRFSPVMRTPLTLAQKVKNIKKAGGRYMEFHDTEAEPEDAPEIAKIVREEGLEIYMCTANLFKRGPEFANGNFGSRDPKIRREAIERTKAYIRVGIEIYGAKIYVYWNGSNGFDIPLSNDYMGMYLRTAESVAEIIEWMIREYGPERTLAFLFEPKKNEPRGWGVPADVGESLAIISLMPPEFACFAGLNPETCHSQMGGNRYAVELALAAAAGKLWYVHLNGGSGIKFDEDRAFGDIDFTIAVETIYTLREIGYKYTLGLDVQPLNTDTEDQQDASIVRSIRNLKRAQICCDRINASELNRLRDLGDQAGVADLISEAISGVKI